MGRSKALLPFGRSYPVTFLEQIVSAMHRAGIRDLFVVGRPGDAALIGAVDRLSVNTRFISNTDHDLGQLTSIVAAINAVDRPGIQGLMVMPVDLPLVRVETFERLLQASAARPASIVRPAHRGRHGHPIVFDRASFGALRRADPAIGAKPVLRAHEDRILNVEVEDTGVLRDIDSIEEYVAVFGGSPESFETAVPS